jgi:hypothetical protein
MYGTHFFDDGSDIREALFVFGLMANNLGQPPYRALRAPWPGHPDVKR